MNAGEASAYRKIAILFSIFSVVELDRDSTCSILEYMGSLNKQRYRTLYYNLEVILCGISRQQHQRNLI